MNDIAIRVENLSKRYRIGLKEETHDTFIGALSSFMRSPVKNLKHLRRMTQFGEIENDSPDIIWALRDISFTVQRGEVVGVIGRNGAGKSTLLKILSRITHPTTGHVEIDGRVASLLEVGTGFHKELTGRENVYLNGTILGMTKTEIDSKFDEIVDFSGIEKFIDTPVKYYSSGMRVRLAFSVAAHLEPEILLIDEVLAVGDVAFQKKSLGKMGEVAQKGRTVLFVSHNMGAIARLCHRSLLIKDGQLHHDGLSQDVISTYMGSVAKEWKFEQSLKPDLPMCLIETEIHSENISNNQNIFRHQPITIKIKYAINKPVSSAHVYCALVAMDGGVVFGTSDADLQKSLYGTRQVGIYHCEFQIPAKMLNLGNYSINISLGIPYQRNFQENVGVLSFEVVDIEQEGISIHKRRTGAVWLDLPWHYVGAHPLNSPQSIRKKNDVLSQ